MVFADEKFNFREAAYKERNRSVDRSPTAGNMNKDAGAAVALMNNVF
jgi:hypothetical protein